MIERLSGEVLEFARSMVEACQWTADDLLYFLEKPWKWQREFEDFLAAIYRFEQQERQR